MRHLLTEDFTNQWEFQVRYAKHYSIYPRNYGNIAEEKVELNGLLYVIERLPVGIEECRFINLTSDEGYSKSHFQAIVPPKKDVVIVTVSMRKQMNVEITRDVRIFMIFNAFDFILSNHIKLEIEFYLMMLGVSAIGSN
jgi:hypothetical protein